MTSAALRARRACGVLVVLVVLVVVVSVAACSSSSPSVTQPRALAPTGAVLTSSAVAPSTAAVVPSAPRPSTLVAGQVVSGAGSALTPPATPVSRTVVSGASNDCPDLADDGDRLIACAQVIIGAAKTYVVVQDAGATEETRVWTVPLTGTTARLALSRERELDDSDPRHRQQEQTRLHRAVFASGVSAIIVLSFGEPYRPEVLLPVQQLDVVQGTAVTLHSELAGGFVSGLDLYSDGMRLLTYVPRADGSFEADTLTESTGTRWTVESTTTVAAGYPLSLAASLL